MAENRFLRDIPWETRNLGIQSFAINDEFINNPDQAVLQETIARQIKEYKSIYIQARIPKANISVIPMLERTGFCFIETALVPYSDLRKNDVLNRFTVCKGSFVPARYDLVNLGMSISDKHENSCCAVIKEIAGESFTDDRFHLDAKCTKEVADRRYTFWVEDLLNDSDVKFDLLLYTGKIIAFMARKGDNLLLAGFSRQYVKGGLGDFFWLSVLEQMKREGFTQVHTMISANNTPVLNLYARIGFKFKEPSATFHYWGICEQ